MLTERLEVRLPVESDRPRFVSLFQNAAFMTFSAGVHDVASANARFDTMLDTAARVPFAKQPVVERSSGEIVGYSGAAYFEFGVQPGWSTDIASCRVLAGGGTRPRPASPCSALRERRSRVSSWR